MLDGLTTDWPVIVLLLAVGTVVMFAWCWWEDRNARR